MELNHQEEIQMTQKMMESGSFQAWASKRLLSKKKSSQNFNSKSSVGKIKMWFSLLQLMCLIWLLSSILWVIIKMSFIHRLSSHLLSSHLHINHLNNHQYTSHHQFTNLHNSLRFISHLHSSQSINLLHSSQSINLLLSNLSLNHHLSKWEDNLYQWKACNSS